MWDQLTTGALLKQSANRWPDHVYVIDGDRRRTYIEFFNEAQAVARGMRQLGIGPDQRVGLYMANRLEWLLVDFACGMLGATAVPLNTRLRVREVTDILRRADVQMIVWDDTAAEVYGQLPTDVTDGVASIRVTDEDAGAIDQQLFGQLLNAGHRDTSELVFAAKPDDLAYIVFTSGTTSLPKGVMIRHRNAVQNCAPAADRIGIADDDVLLVASPLYTSFGCFTIKVSATSHGATLILLDRYSPTRMLELIREHGVTTLPAVDTMLGDLVRTVQAGAEPVALRRIFSAPLTSRTVGLVRDFLGAEQVFAGYGLTEASAVSSFYPVAEDVSNLDELEPLPHVRMTVADTAGDEVPVGEQGEICVESPGVMQGYWRDQAATDAVLEASGRLHTGDLGQRLDDGRVRFLGRIKETIKVGGMNVSALEVEGVIKEHPAVDEACLVGIPDDRLNEVGAAVIRRAMPVTAEEIKGFCQERLADFKVPRVVAFVEDFPLTGSGKIRKGELVDGIRSGRIIAE